VSFRIGGHCTLLFGAVEVSGMLYLQWAFLRWPLALGLE